MKILLGFSLLITMLLLYRPLESHLPYDYPKGNPLKRTRRLSSNSSSSSDHGDLQSLFSIARIALRKADARTPMDIPQRRRLTASSSLREGLLRRPPLGAAAENVSFMLVTGERPSVCKSAAGAHVLLQSYKNKVEYCSLHGCKVWYMLESWEEGFYGVWARYPALLRLMRSLPSIEWFMWMDADAIFTDLNFSIPFHLYRSWNKNVIAHGFPHLLYGEEGNWFSLNAGVFLIRNCEWSYEFLGLWRDMGRRERRQEAKRAFNRDIKNRPLDLRADDQSALIYLLRQMRNETESRVHMEAAYFLHGYWELMVDRYEEMEQKGRLFMHGDQQWPFTTHFCGCSFCGSSKDPVSPRCLLGFTRAYTFAHNQFLLATGANLRHHNLNSSSSSLIPHTPFQL